MRERIKIMDVDYTILEATVLMMAEDIKTGDFICDMDDTSVYKIADAYINRVKQNMNEVHKK